MRDYTRISRKVDLGGCGRGRIKSSVGFQPRAAFRVYQKQPCTRKVRSTSCQTTRSRRIAKGN